VAPMLTIAAGGFALVLGGAVLQGFPALVANETSLPGALPGMFELGALQSAHCFHSFCVRSYSGAVLGRELVPFRHEVV
jgi:hypothetical protein